MRDQSDTKRIAELLDKHNCNRISPEQMTSLFTEDTPDIVLHLATCYRKYHTASDISEMIAANIDFPTQICQLCATHTVRYFINTGSFFEYDFLDTPLTEQSREKAFNLYASTKQAFNSILRYYTEQYDLRVLTIRLFSPYGPGDNEKLIPVAIRSILQGTEMQLANPTQRLSFTYIDDIVDAYILAIEKISCFQKPYDVVNIAPSETTSLLDALQTLEHVSWKKLHLNIWSGAEQDIWNSSFWSDYASELLDWHAKTPLSEWLLLTYYSYNNAI